MSILLTGGTGFIGSHTAVELMEAGYHVVIVDDLSNSRETVIDGIEKITGWRPTFYRCDVRDEDRLGKVFADHRITAVMHFAGLKAVSESVEKPLKYYGNNIGSTVSLLRLMKRHGVDRLVFSSSATVYGTENHSPYTEDMRTGCCSNPYSWSKHIIEQILMDEEAASGRWSMAILRCFNPVGAHKTGLIGEDPRGTPNNLMPAINRIAAGGKGKLTIYGGDYDTPDGTCRRDYIHVMDIARGHLKAMEYMEKRTGVEIFNLGTGRSYSALEVIKAFESCNGVPVPYEIGDRRRGDLPEFYANADKAGRVLGWKAIQGLDDMCMDSWRWTIGENT